MAHACATQRLSPVVELVGPAGAGKTAATRALVARASVEAGMIWGLPVSSLLLNGTCLIPSFIPLWCNARSLLWNETRHMVRLRSIRRTLLRQAPRAVIFDEGPIFALVWLRGFGHPVMRSEASAPWWRATFGQWSGLVNTIIVLDAPDELLAQRIRSRPEDHEIKQSSDREIRAWVARFREALEWVLEGLEVGSGPTVVRLESGTDTPKELAERALAAVEGHVYAG
jgi:AAA domain-containing protein